MDQLRTAADNIKNGRIFKDEEEEEAFEAVGFTSGASFWKDYPCSIEVSLPAK